MCGMVVWLSGGWSLGVLRLGVVLVVGRREEGGEGSVVRGIAGSR